MLLSRGLSGFSGGSKAVASGASYLDSVLASTVMDLDATIAASYLGSGTDWKNLTSSPADSSFQTDYDQTIQTGVSFSGTAGDKAAYLSFDGSGYISIKSGTNTTFLNALHKTTGGSDWWMCATGNFLATAATIFATLGSTLSGYPGIRIILDANTTLNPAQGSDASFKQIVTTATFTASSDNIIILSYSHASGVISVWINTRTAETDSMVFSTSVNNATTPERIGANGSGSSKLPSGTKLYSFAMGNEYLNDTKAGAIINHLNTRHGRVYA